MGRKNKYETHVSPRLEEIAEWIQLMTEDQIARRLGISPRSFATYKTEHKELQEALQKGTESLVEDLKLTLKKKAKGFTYTERKITVRNVNGKKIRTVEEFERYAQPDTGAIHLLLKNLDGEWRQDDLTTVELKKQKLQLEKDKAEQNIYE